MNKKIVAAGAACVLAWQAHAADVTYREHIRPLLKAQCAECHGDDSPTLSEFDLDKEKYRKAKQGPRLSSYETLLQLIAYPDAGALMRRLDDGSQTADRKPGNMFKHLGETDSERGTNLKLIKAWLGDGAWNLQRWEKREAVPAVTKEQLDRLLLKY